MGICAFLKQLSAFGDATLQFSLYGYFQARRYLTQRF